MLEKNNIKTTQGFHIQMSLFCASKLNTQNDVLLKNLMEFYNQPDDNGVKNNDNLKKMMAIINGETPTSLRIIDWFVTNYAKKYYTVLDLVSKTKDTQDSPITTVHRFKVYNDYKLKLKAYGKRRFDPFCRWDRITVPYDNNNYMETTIGQLNFFKWAIENDIINHINENYHTIENDMNFRNSTARSRESTDSNESGEQNTKEQNNKTRKKREELSVSACKCIKKETVKIVVKFN